ADAVLQVEVEVDGLGALRPQLRRDDEVGRRADDTGPREDRRPERNHPVGAGAATESEEQPENDSGAPHTPVLAARAARPPWATLSGQTKDHRTATSRTTTHEIEAGRDAKCG